jgi:hypothetical protein
VTGERPDLPARLKRDLALETGYRCPFSRCSFDVQNYCHIVDRAKGGPDVFGNLLAACAAHHHMHTVGQIPTHDLRVLKARLAWEGNRYTLTELRYLARFAHHCGTHFGHSVGDEQGIRNITRDGYVERIGSVSCAEGAAQNGQGQWRLTNIGRLFAMAWSESGAPQMTSL